MREPLNFKWHLPGLLATGGNTDTHEKLDWILSEGFSCIVVLEAVPDEIRQRFVRESISHSIHIVKEKDDPPVRKLAGFIAGGLLHDRKVYIQCSTGAARSQGLARAFVEQCDLHMANYLGRRANDLNHGDIWDSARGHEAFAGIGLKRAISFLTSTLESEDEAVQLAGADTLVELMEHADHGCFDSGSMHRLNGLKQRALELSIRLNPKYTETYYSIVNQFTRVYEDWMEE